MKRSIPCVCVCLSALVLAGCGSPAKPEKAVKTVVVITNNTSNFWRIMQKGCEKADAELPGTKVAFKTTFGGTVKEQERYINEAFMKDEADAIAISPIDPVAQQAFLNNAAKSTLLITQDSDAPASDRALYLGADNHAAGRQAGELVKKALPRGGKIMVFVGKREVLNAQERFAGLQEALQGSQVQVIDLMTDNHDYIKAEDNAAQTMEKYPDVAALVGLWAYNGAYILRAVKSANKVGKVKIVCFDDDPETLKGIKEGGIFGTVAQQPFEYGYEAVQLTTRILQGDKSVIPANKIVFIPTVVVQRGNVDQHKSKQDQLLGSQ